MHAKNELHPNDPSITDLSFTVTLSLDTTALFLKRAKRVKLADKDCKMLTTEIVQRVVNKIANSADNHPLRFLRCETTTTEQGRAYVRAPTAAVLCKNSTVLSYDTLTPGETQARRVYKHSGLTSSREHGTSAHPLRSSACKTISCPSHERR